MKVKSKSEVAQSCLTLHNPMVCSLPGSSVHEFFQARVLEWVAIVFSTVQANSVILGKSLPLCVAQPLYLCVGVAMVGRGGKWIK